MYTARTHNKMNTLTPVPGFPGYYLSEEGDLYRNYLGLTTEVKPIRGFLFRLEAEIYVYARSFKRRRKYNIGRNTLMTHTFCKTKY